MASEKNAVALTGFFSSLFHNLPRLLLTNVLFALPFAVIFGIFFLINTLTGLNSMFIYFLTIIPLFPFYAGVTQVTSHMVRGEENVDVFSNFIGGIKENLPHTRRCDVCRCFYQLLLNCPLSRTRFKERNVLCSACYLYFNCNFLSVYVLLCSAYDGYF